VAEAVAGDLEGVEDVGPVGRHGMGVLNLARLIVLSDGKYGKLGLEKETTDLEAIGLPPKMTRVGAAEGEEHKELRQHLKSLPSHQCRVH